MGTDGERFGFHAKFLHILVAMESLNEEIKIFIQFCSTEIFSLKIY